jgi:hypothetical protein
MQHRQYTIKQIDVLEYLLQKMMFSYGRGVAAELQLSIKTFGTDQ